MVAGAVMEKFVDRQLKSDTKAEERVLIECSYWLWSGENRNIQIGQTYLVLFKSEM